MENDVTEKKEPKKQEEEWLDVSEIDSFWKEVLLPIVSRGCFTQRNFCKAGKFCQRKAGWFVKAKKKTDAGC